METSAPKISVTSQTLGRNNDQVREHNLAAILTLLSQSKSLTRSELVELSGLNRSTISVLMTELQALGLVSETSPDETPNKGRPSFVASLSSEVAVFGVNVESSFTDVCLVSLRGEIIASQRITTPELPAPESIIAQIKDAISNLKSAQGDTLRIAGIGVAVAPRDGNDTDTLMKCADAALLRAKANGQNTFRFYSPEMDADASRRLGLEAALRLALQNNELTVHYQPQISLDSGNMIGMEALLRWNTREFGPVSPAEFIPIAEDTGLILPIGEWVLRTACRQTRQWLDLGLANLRIAVNLSPRQFRQSNLTGLVSQCLAETGLPATALELEITESSLIEEVDEAIAQCRMLKKLGVKISLDDFGTGYSSLAYISRFPFDKIKIDQSFIRDITENPVNAAIANAAIVLARSLNLSVLAEGVETEAQASFLRSRRCDAMQGYLFSRPVPAAEFEQLLASRKRMTLSDKTEQSRQTLLIVDDEPNILAALTRLFRREEFNILTAQSPTEAFEHLAKQSVQVILSDQRMPEMSGTEFFARVRQLYPDTIRIVLTGYTDLDSVTDAINRGAIYKFLTKPWDGDILREQIREAFRKAQGADHETR